MHTGPALGLIAVATSPEKHANDTSRVRDKTDARLGIDAIPHVGEYLPCVLNLPATKEQIHRAQTAPSHGQQLIGAIRIDVTKHCLGLVAASLPTQRVSKHDRSRQAAAAIEREPGQLLSMTYARHSHRARRRIDDHVEVRARGRCAS